MMRWSAAGTIVPASSRRMPPRGTFQSTKANTADAVAHAVPAKSVRTGWLAGELALTWSHFLFDLEWQCLGVLLWWWWWRW